MSFAFKQENDIPTILAWLQRAINSELLTIAEWAEVLCVFQAEVVAWLELKNFPRPKDLWEMYVVLQRSLDDADPSKADIATFLIEQFNKLSYRPIREVMLAQPWDTWRLKDVRDLRSTLGTYILRYRIDQMVEEVEKVSAFTERFALTERLMKTIAAFNISRG